MGYIPPDAQWYTADLVVQFTVEGARRTTVHVTTVLVRADSPAEAYERALKLGREHNGRDKNFDGQLVVSRFLGLRDLNVMYDGLEHGSELGYTEHVGLTASKTKALVSKKRELGVFAPITRREDVPDYSSGDVQRELLTRLADSPSDRKRRR